MQRCSLGCGDNYGVSYSHWINNLALIFYIVILQWLIDSLNLEVSITIIFAENDFVIFDNFVICNSIMHYCTTCNPLAILMKPNILVSVGAFKFKNWCLQAVLYYTLSLSLLYCKNFPILDKPDLLIVITWIWLATKTAFIQLIIITFICFVGS